jgi:hypothetical protein
MNFSLKKFMAQKKRTKNASVKSLHYMIDLHNKLVISNYIRWNQTTLNKHPLFYLFSLKKKILSFHKTINLIIKKKKKNYFASKKKQIQFNCPVAFKHDINILTV